MQSLSTLINWLRFFLQKDPFNINTIPKYVKSSSMFITSPLKVNTGLTISLQLLFRKITILVFEALTYNFQVLQYKYMAFRADCNSM